MTIQQLIAILENRLSMKFTYTIESDYYSIFEVGYPEWAFGILITTLNSINQSDFRTKKYVEDMCQFFYREQ